jgi:hypothetical protein
MKVWRRSRLGSAAIKHAPQSGRGAKRIKQTLIFIRGCAPALTLDLIYNPDACIGSAGPGRSAA